MASPTRRISVHGGAALGASQTSTSAAARTRKATKAMSVSDGERPLGRRTGRTRDGEGRPQQLGPDRGHGGGGERGQRHEGEAQPLPGPRHGAVERRARRSATTPDDDADEPHAVAAGPHPRQRERATSAGGRRGACAARRRSSRRREGEGDAGAAAATGCCSSPTRATDAARAAVTSSGASRRTTHATGRARWRRAPRGSSHDTPGSPKTCCDAAHEQLGQPLVQPPRLRRHRAPRVGPVERPGLAQAVAGREVPEGVGVADRLGHLQDGEEHDQAGEHLPQQQGQGPRRSGPAGATATGSSGRDGRLRARTGVLVGGRGESPRVGRHRPIIPADRDGGGFWVDLRPFRPSAALAAACASAIAPGARRARIGGPTDHPSGRTLMKKLLTGALALALSVSLAACSKSVDQAATPSAPAGSTSSATTPSDTSSDTPTGTGAPARAPPARRPGRSTSRRPRLR